LKPHAKDKPILGFTAI
ncbi:hypothetical protein CP8484711_2233B, partial [Chlamydia psittaci 84-8471/1]